MGIDALVAELERLSKAATPGPLRFLVMGSEGCRVLPDCGDIRERGKYIARVDGRTLAEDQANAALYVAAVNALPTLLSALKERTEALRRLQLTCGRVLIGDDSNETIGDAVIRALGIQEGRSS